MTYEEWEFARGEDRSVGAVVTGSRDRGPTGPWGLRPGSPPETHPVDDSEAAELLGLTAGALGGSAAARRTLFRAVEARIQARRFGATVDDWHPHIEFLRG